MDEPWPKGARCWPALQVHQSITATAVQQAQRSTAAAFDQFMDRCLHAQWEEVKPGGG